MGELAWDAQPSALRPRATTRALGRRKLAFADLSYRYKVPISFTLVILITAVTVSGALLLRSYHDLQRDLVAGAESLGRALSRSLAPVLLRDDVWQAYEIATTPFDSPAELQSEGKMIVVLNSELRVYVSSHPRRFTMLEPLEIGSALLAPVHRVLRDHPELRAPVALADVVPGHTVVAVPILSDDGNRLGTVVLAHADALFLPRFRAILWQVVLSTLAVLGVLLPLGWYAGNRMVNPLVKLTEALGHVARQPSSRLTSELWLGGDEIGRLGQQFKKMLDELDHMRALEKQMIMADRLAALGRLTAGIAHEINNPLGGMLNAINTQKRHGARDPLVDKTLSLLERGLLQIKSTVAALLVEARMESHTLAPEDIEDTRTLILPELAEKRVRFEWRNELPVDIELPAAPVRQIMINLLLNAVQAATDDGFVACHIAMEQRVLVLDVRNDGRSLTEMQMEHLFEPFSSESGNGLGLWVTYQIVQQLKGDIRASSEDGFTRFIVRLPVDGTEGGNDHTA